MRLYLDDIRPMPLGFDMKATTGELAISLLRELEITHISFDHDLGEDIATGYDVAKQIEQWAYEGKIAKLTWEIHSANPVGRKNIKAAMEKADYYWSKK